MPCSIFNTMLHAFYFPGVVPSVNNLYMTGGKLAGRKVLTKQQRAFRAAVASVVKTKRATLQNLVVKIYYRPPDKRRRDVDNYIKAIFDALTAAGYWIDDAQSVSVRSCFLEPKKRADAGVYVFVESTDKKTFDDELVDELSRVNK